MIIFQSDALQLFDICSCKCAKLTKFDCVKSNKVPQIEHAFLIDQRGPRKMGIGLFDASTSKILAQRAQRKAKYQAAAPKSEPQPIASSSTEDNIVTTARARPDFSHLFAKQALSSSNSNTETTEAETEGDVGSKKYNTLRIPTVALTADRYDVPLSQQHLYQRVTLTLA